jgi:transcription elongation factor GreA
MFGATVTLVDVETEKEVTYSLVGTEEANLDKGLISVGTPIARALLGKTEGDEVTVQAPGRTRVYEVVKVAYKEIKLD